ncbi:MAG: response regulator transcription factor [Candidatus Eisenbacteria bacterium]
MRILVADDHEVVRQGLRTLLESKPGWEVCGEASDGREAIQLAAQLQPDVVVLDLAMPVLNGLEATRGVLAAAPRTEVVILTMHESEQYVRQVLEAGARAFVLKSDAGHDLLAAIEAVRQGRPFFTGKISSTVHSACLKSAETTRPVRSILTSREREIVQRLAEGRTARGVAAELSISPKTVEAHRSNVMRKLDLHSVSELVRYAVRNGIISA